jgi:hypothetical protein
MNEELLQMAETWKKTALEMLQKCELASHSAMANAMLLACAEKLEYKIKDGERLQKTALPSMQAWKGDSPS